MRILTTAALLFALSACSSTPKPNSADAVPAELAENVLQGPDGWNYVGVSVDGVTPEFVLAKDGERYVIDGSGYARFVPTLGGNVFAVDELGVWWRFLRGERVESMPWTDLRAIGEISGEGDQLTGRWPVVLAAGGCAKVDETGAVVEHFPNAVGIELVVHSWIFEHADGTVNVDAPGGEPLIGGQRYATPAGTPVIYFPEDRLLFDPVRFDFKRMSAVPAVRILATEPDRVLVGLVPSFEGDETVALYDYYAGATLERQQASIEMFRIIEPDYSPHLTEGSDPTQLDVALCFAADDGHWSAYAIGADRQDPRLELVLRGTGDRARAQALLEAELVSRRSHAIAP